MPRIRNIVAAGVVLIAFALIAGCSKDDPKPCPTCPDKSGYLPQTSPENVLENLETAYKNRDIGRYSAQFAYDFVFEFDPEDLGTIGLPPGTVWHFGEDSLSSRNMFNNENLSNPADRVTDIRVRLTFGSSVAVTELGRETWRKILVTNTFLEVQQQGTSESVTLQVSGDQADFYFRKGRTPEDVSSNLWYIVRWRDRPKHESPAPRASTLSQSAARAGDETVLGGHIAGSGALSVATRSSSWGEVKVAYH